MNALGARLGFWIVLILLGVFAGGYVMWGQVKDARMANEEAQRRLLELGKQLGDLQKRQSLTDATLALRRSQEANFTAQLSRLRSDLAKVIDDDPEAASWAADCVPAAVAERMRIKPDPRCNPSPSR